jgi:ATP-dependent exoDNAse (exonuclease V) alpha subunit
MFVKNDQEKRFVNGTIGIVKALEENEIRIEINGVAGDSKIIKLERMEWEILKYQLDPKDSRKIATRVAGTFEQFPLNLAWAITIHKSQGKTFDKIIIDMGNSGAFAHGQTYVALSRCRTLEGIVLRQKLTPRDVIVDPAINSFLSSYQ